MFRHHATNNGLANDIIPIGGGVMHIECRSLINLQYRAACLGIWASNICKQKINPADIKSNQSRRPLCCSNVNGMRDRGDINCRGARG